MNISIKDAYVIVNRMEGAKEALAELGVKMHSLLDILQITKILYIYYNLMYRNAL